MYLLICRSIYIIFNISVACGTKLRLIFIPNKIKQKTELKLEANETASKLHSNFFKDGQDIEGTLARKWHVHLHTITKNLNNVQIEFIRNS